MFNNLFALTINRTDGHIKSENKTVCELGNQTLRCNAAIKHIWKGRNISADVVPKTAKDFFTAIGYKKYVAIDVNENLDAVAMDLNTIVKYQYGFTEQFDLVTNNGTGEHVFNQYSVFANMHNLCKTGGVMLNILPCYRWPDHGFYNFNPILFASLAKYNNYEILFSGFGTNNAKIRNDYPFSVVRNKRWSRELKMREWEFEPMLYVAMRKLEDKEFVVPQQEMYSGENITTEELRKKYIK